MKNILSFILCCTIALSAIAQSPEGFKYQAVLRDGNNASFSDKDVIITVKILKGESASELVYTEAHNVTTSPAGLVSLNIGQGASTDNFNTIEWSQGPYFVQIAVDDVVFSTSQLMSVPYSKHATTAERIESFNVSESGDTLFLNGEAYVIPGISASNTDPYKDQIVIGGTNDEEVHFAAKATDGSMWLGGTTASFNGDVTDNHGETDIWIVKLNSDKSIAWQKTIGGSKFETFSKLILTDDGGCLIGGTTESSDGDITTAQGDFDILLAKISGDGVVAWVETFGGGNTEFLNHLSIADNGDIWVGATTFSHAGDVLLNYGDADIWVFRLDEDRAITWQESYGGSQYDALKKLEINADNSFILYGITESDDKDVSENNGALDMWVAKIDADGAVTAQVSIGDANNDDLIDVASLGSNKVLGGLTFASDWDPLNSKKDKNIKLVQISEDLTVLNSTQVGGSFTENIIKLIPISSTEIIAFAEASSFDGDVADNHGDQDVWILKLNSSLNISSSVCIGGVYRESLQACVQLDNGGFLIAGMSESNDGDIDGNNGMQDIFVMQLDEDFNIVKSRIFGGTYDETIISILPEDDDKFTLVGTTSSGDYGIVGLHGQAGKNKDIWVLTEEF